MSLRAGSRAEDEPAGSKPISIVTVVDDLLEIGL